MSPFSHFRFMSPNHYMKNIKAFTQESCKNTAFLSLIILMHQTFRQGNLYVKRFPGLDLPPVKILSKLFLYKNSNAVDFG